VNIKEYIAGEVQVRRKALAYTLRDLAERSGVSASMLSAIEAGEKSPTVSVLSQIAAALDVPVSQLIEPRESGAAIVTRGAKLRKVIDQAGVVREHLGALAKDSKIEFLRFTIPAKGKTGGFAPHRPGTIEHIFVQKGRIIVRLDKETHELKAGDVIVYKANLSHGMDNPGPGDAVAYLVIEQGQGGR
jgi:XRE family transcriptional regulator, regulator of sulfur utilization